MTQKVERFQPNSSPSFPTKEASFYFRWERTGFKLPPSFVSFLGTFINVSHFLPNVFIKLGENWSRSFNIGYILLSVSEGDALNFWGRHTIRAEAKILFPWNPSLQSPSQHLDLTHMRSNDLDWSYFIHSVNCSVSVNFIPWHEGLNAVGKLSHCQE